MGCSGDPAVAIWPILVIVAIAAMVAVAIAVNMLMKARRARTGHPEAPVSYRHTYRLFATLGFLIAAALIARSWAVPHDFGRYGYYRAGAPVDERARAPRYQGEQKCAECHEEEAAAHAKDVHHTVQCEDCHGPGDKHADDPANVDVELHKTKAFCLICHRRLNARPGAFPQVSWRQHFEFVGVKEDQKDKIECIQCHNPHQPLYLRKPVTQARLHPLIQRCRDCHLGRTDETLKRPPEHPAIFQCSYCHAEKAREFAKSTHKNVRCTTCHLFVKISDFAGRIVRNDDPRFCLLCHRSASFRKEGTPTIEWPAHLAEWDPDIKDEHTPCTTCHADAIHGEQPQRSAHE